MSLALLIYGIGVAIGLLMTDARPVARVVLALLWPVGPLAFTVTFSLLLAASLIAFPIVGAIVAAAFLAWWVWIGLG